MQLLVAPTVNILKLPGISFPKSKINSKHNLLSAENSTTGLTTSYTYNSRGLPLTVTVTDEEGQHATTTYTYNDYDYLTSVTDTTGATTQYSYTGKIAKGYAADLVIFDYDKTFTVKNEDHKGKCGWTPYDGEKLRGVIENVMVDGIIVNL